MREKKIPTLVGLLLVGMAVMIFRLAVERVSPLLSRANTTNAPQAVTITNISDTAFTVTWFTKTPTNGAVVVDGGIAKTTVFDERDALSPSPTTQKSSYSTHSVTIRNLKSETDYTFRILVNGSAFLDNGNPYEIRTPPTLTGLGGALEPAYGQITLPDGNPGEGAIVFLTVTGGQTLSTLVKSSGSWVIPLNLVRTESLDRYLETFERMNETISVRAGEGESTALTDTLNDNPVPSITIGKTYDFRKIQAGIPQNPPLANAPPPGAGNPAVLGTNTTINKTVAITKPAQNAVLPTNLPLIQGTGIPGNIVSVLIGIDTLMTGTATVGTDGVWYFTPTKPLAAGKQSITMTTRDANEKTIALTTAFTVLKSGTQVLGDATPSATLTPTTAVIPTITGEPLPTSTLSGEPLPTSGNTLPLIMLLILGMGLLTGGAFLMVK